MEAENKGLASLKVSPTVWSVLAPTRTCHTSQDTSVKYLGTKMKFGQSENQEVKVMFREREGGEQKAHFH